jgi:hypothetical protein
MCAYAVSSGKGDAGQMPLLLHSQLEAAPSSVVTFVKGIFRIFDINTMIF